MKRIRGLLLFVLALFMVAGMSVSTANVFAKDTTVPEPKASMKAEGTLVINDIVPDSSGIPRSSCKYTYTISATSGTLSGTYTITKGATVVLADTPLPASGQFELCANETATISGLADGTYMVTQATPTYANYIDTTVSVNDSDPQKSLTANVNMVADQTTTVVFTNNYNVPTVNGDISTKPCELHWYAKSFINYLTENFPNENYLSKVKKAAFPTNVGRFEVQHWIDDGSNLYWRMPVSTDYEIRNGKVVINFTDSQWKPKPETLTFYLGDTVYGWRTGQDFYESVTGYAETYQLLNTAPEYTFTETQLIINIPYMPANSSYLFSFYGPPVDGKNAVLAGQSYYLDANFTAEYKCVQAKVIWNGGPLADSDTKVQLYQNGVAFGDAITITKAMGNSYLWTHLPFLDENGKPYNYTIKQLSAFNQYKTTIVDHTEAGSNVNKFEIVNTYMEPQSEPTVAEPSKPTEPTAPGTVSKGTSPRTGDEGNATGYLFLVLASATVLVFTGKRLHQ